MEMEKRDFIKIVKETPVMTINEAKEIVDKYIEVATLCGMLTPDEIQDYLEKIERVGLEISDKLPCGDFTIRNDAYITNSAKHYEFKDDEYYIHWDNGNVGKYMFVRQDLYYEIDDEWSWFIEKLREGCLDYDPINDHIIYDIETGMKKYKEYDDLCKEMKKKIRIKEVEVEKKRLKEKLAALEAEGNNE